MDEHTTISKHTILDQESPQSNVKIHVLRGIRTTKPSIEINNHLIWQASPPPPSYFRFSLWPHTRCLRHPLSCHYMHYPSPSIRHSQSSPIPNPTPTPSPQNHSIALQTFETLTRQPRRSNTFDARYSFCELKAKKYILTKFSSYKIMTNKKYKHVQGECYVFIDQHMRTARRETRLMAHFLRNLLTVGAI
jgi:hypothetical protein